MKLGLFLNRFSLIRPREPWYSCALLSATVLLWIDLNSCGAHGISGQCLAHGARVTVQAYFDTDEPAIGAIVRVYNSEGKEVAGGTTDDLGAFTFPHPGIGNYKVVIDAGPEHRAELRLDLAQDRYAVETQTSTGPSRSTFTGYKLGKIAAGLLVIAILAVLVRQFLSRRNRSAGPGVQ